MLTVNGMTHPSPSLPVTGLASDYPGGQLIEAHTHPWGQLLFATTGAMWVSTEDGTFVVPTNRAVWVPPRMEHSTRMASSVAMRSLFVEAGAATASGLPECCRVIEVSPLLRELIVRLHADPFGAQQGLISQLILTELRAGDTMPLHLPQPRDARLCALCDRLMADPGCAASLDDLASEAGASPRTIARLFQRETGMRFTDWRQQLRLAAALTLLAEGLSGKSIAARLGFRSASAFTAAFRRGLGRPPSAFR